MRELIWPLTFVIAGAVGMKVMANRKKPAVGPLPDELAYGLAGAPRGPTLSIHESRGEMLAMHSASSGARTLARATTRMETAGASREQAAATAMNALREMSGHGIPVGPDPVIQGQNLLANDPALTKANRMSAKSANAMRAEMRRIGAGDGRREAMIIRNTQRAERAFISRAGPKTQSPSQATKSAEWTKARIRALNDDIGSMKLQLENLKSGFGQDAYADRLARTLTRRMAELEFHTGQLAILRRQGSTA